MLVTLNTNFLINNGFRYLYTDLYAAAVWAGTENPENSGNFTSSKLNVTCARDSPIPCDTVPGSSFPSLGFITSFGQDNRKDVFLLASNGMYRVVRPSRCNYTCSNENVTAYTSSGSVTSPSPSAAAARWLSNPHMELLLLLLSGSFLLML